MTHYYNSYGQQYRLPALTWTMVYDGPLPLPSTSQPGCLSRLPKYTAIYQREFSYGQTADGFEKGHAAIMVEAGETTAGIKRAQAESATDTYLSCWATSQVRATLADSRGGVRLTGPTTRRLEYINVGAPNLTVTYVTPYTFQGQAKVLYTVVSWTVYDRYRTVSWVETCCGRISMADVQPYVLLIAQRMQAATLPQ